MLAKAYALAVSAMLFGLACASPSRTPTTPSREVEREPQATIPKASPATVPSTGAPKPQDDECQPPDCALFDSVERAFESVLSRKPAVLGIGEAHALLGTEEIESTTSRFTRQLLPMLEGAASDIVIELMEPDARCHETTQAVKEAQEPVTSAQAQFNQNQFIQLGIRAKELGIQPHVLYPTCAEYDRVLKAEEDRILVMLEMIATLTFEKTKAILERNRRVGRKALVLLYGGAAHNDVAPRPGRELWSYGPRLTKHTNARYIELDLVVREFIKDSEAWQSLPWSPRFNRDAHPEKVVVMKPAPSSFVLFFPKSS